MKIAVFHELHAGGARRVVNEFAKELKKNHIVDLYIVDEKKNTSEKDCFTKIFFYKFLPKKWKGNNWKIRLYKDTIELFRLYVLHKKIAKEINKKHYNVVIAHPSQYTQAPFLLRFLSGKKIYYAHETLRIAYESALGISKKLPWHKYVYECINRWMRKNIDRVNISKADIILTNSMYTKANVQRAYGLKGVVCSPGVDANVFKPISVNKEIDILFFGDKNTEDGWELLQRATAIMKTKPIVYMHASGKQWKVSDKEMNHLYAKAKIVVCLTSHEPFGLIPLEAMSCGVPIVALNEGGYKETVQDEVTGYLVTRDEKSLAKKLTFLLSHKNSRVKMGKDGRENALQQWTWDARTKKLEKLLSDLLK